MKLPTLLPTALTALSLASSSTAQNKTTEQIFNAKRTMNLGIVAYPGFEPLDIFGPLEIFYQLSQHHKIALSVIAPEAGLVGAGIPPHPMEPGGPLMDTSYVINPQIQATHSFENAPALDVLLVPGGFGNLLLDQANNTVIEDFIASRFERLDYLLSVCTGALSLAKSGVLNGRRVTTSKAAWGDPTRFGENIDWVPNARWVVDGKIWSSSGVAAGMDMTYAFLQHFYGEKDESLSHTMNLIEYAPHTDPHWDPFAIVHEVPGADMDGELESCVRPVGF